MAETVKGIIQGWRRKMKRGYIQLENGKRLPFTFDVVTNAEKPQHVRNNMRVSAVIENGVIQSVTVEGVEQPIPQPVKRPHPGSFLNPYNFVRYLEQPTTSPSDQGRERVLWRCAPPPHDRYVGLTGRILCTVENVTPLFIADSHAITETALKNEDGNSLTDSYGNPRVHRKYRFFTLWDEKGKKQPAIPASSLRGMLRSVYEAITNSCFGVFDGERRLEFREPPEFGNRVKGYAAIVRRLATEDQPGQVQRCQIAKIGAYYTGEEAEQNAQSSRGNGVRGWKSGEYVTARVWKTPGGRRIVREFAESEDELRTCGDEEEYVSGWLKITGRGEGTQKLNETLFLDPEKHGDGRTLEFSYEQQEEYNTILQGQFERARTPVPLKTRELSVDDLVWLEMEDEDTIKRLVRVQIPRTPYQKSLNEFLPQHLRTCQDYDSLCPACRAFGWVYPSKRREKIPTDKIVAYAGRVRLSHAKLKKESGRYGDMTLSILSAPKPTTAPFYLLNADGQPDPTVDYKADNARVRGRKFYRHQSQPDSQEYIRAPFNAPHKDHQNRTVSGALQPGSTFTFTVDFENLAPLELGALLYALELEEGMYHRLGYAKPLGFGSVKITVEEIKIIEWEERLRSLGPNAGWKPLSRDQWGEYKAEFLEEMQNIYGDKFDKMVLADLRALLSEPPDLPIHYPRTQKRPDPKGNNYEWFVGNKKHGKNGYPLPLPEEEKGGKGLPLLDKKGCRVS